MLKLSLWGAVYFAFAATTARLTSASVLRIIQYNILPELSESAAKAIDSDLARRFRPLRLNIVASCAALAATLASAFAIEIDLSARCKNVSSVGGHLVVRWFFLLILYSCPNDGCGAFLRQFCRPLKVDSRTDLPSRSSSIDYCYALRIPGSPRFVFFGPESGPRY